MSPFLVADSATKEFMDTSDKILVTGSAGFMGSHIVDALIKAGYTEVYGVDDLSGGSLENVSSDAMKNFLQADLSEHFVAEDIVFDTKPDIIFHLAANAREGASFFQPKDIVHRNYLAYINILEPAIKHGLDKMILFSSMSVYGEQAYPFSEEQERKPVDIYGANKAIMEHTTEMLSRVHDFRYTIIRPHNCFGERQSLRDPYRNVIGIFMNRIMRGEPLYIYGDGEQMRAFSYIDDSLPCYLKCLDDKADGEIINIGGKQPHSINILRRQVCNAMDADPDEYPTQHLPERPHEVKMAWCTSAKSEKILGYDEKVGMAEGIKRMAEWAKHKGSQEWSKEKLTLWNEKAPGIWK